jgi:glycosyltransferase involved in cell wall biosynthesis
VISVIVTCYNRSSIIGKAIESILNQTLSKFEIIVVDDGSVDNSVEVIKSFTDARIKLVCHETNQGQNAALNTGCRLAQYDILAFLDSDDEWLPNCLELYAKEFDKNPNIGFTYGLLVDGPRWVLGITDTYSQALSQGFISSLITLSIKKEALLSVGNYDLRYTICQDDDVCMRLAKNYSFSLINCEIAKTGSSGDNMTLDKVKLAKGWQFFFQNYRKEIINYCGYGVWGRHCITISKYHYDAKVYGVAFYFHLSGIFYLMLFNDKFIVGKNYNFKRLIKCLKKYIKTKIN